MPLLARPTEFPRWATVPGIDALSGQPNVVEPPGAKKNSGWHYLEKPPRNWANWLQRENYNWLTFLDEQKQELHSDYNPNAFETLPAATTPGGLFVDVSGPVDVWLNGEKFPQAATGASIPVAASNTSYIYLDSDRVYKSTTSSDTANASNRLLVARVVTSGVAVTELVTIARKRSQATHVITVGPGESDFSDLSRAIQHAKALLAGTANARVEILINGSLTVGAPVTLDAAVTIRGGGLGSRITWSFTNGAPITLASGSSFARIDDLFFDYTGVTGVGAEHAAIRVQAGATTLNVKVRGNVFNGMMRAVLVSGTGIAGRWRVLDNDFVTPSTSALSIVGGAATAGACDYWVIQGNDFQGPAAASSANAIAMVNSPHTIIAGNTIEGFNKGVVLDSGCLHSTINANTGKFVRTHGIEVDAPGCIITANELDNCGADASTQGGSIRIPTIAGLRCVISGNIVNDWQAGFAISNAAGQSIIADNFCKQITGTATLPVISGGIAVQDDFCNVNDNYIDLLVSAVSGTGGKRNCYGIKCGLFTSGPGVGFTANGAIRCTIQGNMVKNLGGAVAGSGAVGIDAGQRSNVSGNMVDNILGICIRMDASESTISDNAFTTYGFGPLAAPFTLSSTPIDFASASRCVVTGNRGSDIIAGSTTVYPMLFETGSVDNLVRNNRIQAGSAAFQYPFNLHLQDYGTWEQSGQTVGAVSADLTPGLGFPPSSSFAVRMFVRGARVSDGSVNAYEVWAVLTTDGTSVVTFGQVSTLHSFEPVLAPSCTAAVVANLLHVRPTGEAGQTWNWHAILAPEHQTENTFHT